MDDQITYYLRELLKISKKIETRKFNTFEEGDRLVQEETKLVCVLAYLLHIDLHLRSKRYFQDNFEF
tara:strand:+ start:209 stop:409 length:201 start_codon:yes stop_codon:yes gene_type:complete